jgi:hypothetical protein
LDPVEDDITLEILMTHLDPKTMKQFLKTDQVATSDSVKSAPEHGVYHSSGISAVYPESIVDDFVFDPKKSDAGKLAIKAAMGTVKYTSGQIAKNNPQRVNIKTPTASIAVRGTDFTMTVDETGQSLIVLVPSCKDEADVKQFEMDEQRCKVGKIEVTTGAGTVELD